REDRVSAERNGNYVRNVRQNIGPKNYDNAAVRGDNPGTPREGCSIQTASEIFIRGQSVQEIDGGKTSLNRRPHSDGLCTWVGGYVCALDNKPGRESDVQSHISRCAKLSGTQNHGCNSY